MLDVTLAIEDKVVRSPFGPGVDPMADKDAVIPGIYTSSSGELNEETLPPEGMEKVPSSKGLSLSLVSPPRDAGDVPMGTLTADGPPSLTVAETCGAVVVVIPALLKPDEETVCDVEGITTGEAAGQTEMPDRTRLAIPLWPLIPLVMGSRADGGRSGRCRSAPARDPSAGPGAEFCSGSIPVSSADNSAAPARLASTSVLRGGGGGGGGGGAT